MANLHGKSHSINQVALYNPDILQLKQQNGKDTSRMLMYWTCCLQRRLLSALTATLTAKSLRCLGCIAAAFLRSSLFFRRVSSSLQQQNNPLFNIISPWNGSGWLRASSTIDLCDRHPSDQLLNMLAGHMRSACRLKRKQGLCRRGRQQWSHKWHKMCSLTGQDQWRPS